MTLTRAKLHRLTAFEKIELEPDSGRSFLAETSATGKTHILTVAYAACDMTKTRLLANPDKPPRVTPPAGRALGGLAKRQERSSTAKLEVSRAETTLGLKFSNHTKGCTYERVKETGATAWLDQALESVIIPVKHLLPNGPNFGSLYSQRALHPEELDADILADAHLTIRQGPIDKDQAWLPTSHRRAMEGKIRQGALTLALFPGPRREDFDVSRYQTLGIKIGDGN